MSRKHVLKRLLFLPCAFDNGLFSDYISINKPYELGEKLSSNDVIFFGGGVDVNPAFYGQQRLNMTDTPHKQRDSLEIIAFGEAQQAGAFCIGICRGAQFLTIMNGGSLFQDISNHGHDHEIDIDPEIAEKSNFPKTIRVTSTHHQMMNPFGLSKKDWSLIGFTKPRSMFYRYGPPIGESISSFLEKPIEEIPCDPEIIWYPKTKSLAIQGHPEYINQDNKFPSFCKWLFENYISKTSN